ncbi:MAG: zinc ribbon domain-containing protein [Deltaproteobacteria bacterium]|nr:zinc ribbon domain-containing protein [Deltaproteobacteria bacterium]
MPIYEYLCEACGKETELIQKVSEQPAKTCPLCQKDHLVKKTSMSAFHLKGGGWYKDGYNATTPDGSSNQSSPADKPSDKPAAEVPAIKPESKPETKTDTKSESKPVKDSSQSKAS